MQIKIKEKITDQVSILSFHVYGNGHNILGFFKNDEPFDFVIPGREDLPFDADCVQVPFEIIKKELTKPWRIFELLIRLINESTLI